ncbi:methyltransferase domain-containing protein (plasmid) [Methylocystis sp. MJC1]|uniref:methyltransferase domain-containing protein n=1 Tax=Methylocystis sp. MJC1 TaxID=2654282 RepID=UPI0013EC2187|nr:methyltransferase domain-containing protein [Methylocystis sp. MJC1]KAF2991378.1 Ubiquinone/menaquinone biosynthesis C-methyltransferase UbiE [Methylocystis sp. MJC1]MBU6529504.1 methyltransferase domain-containing protein [Methylocystis sp. MJC1]UZX14277.1 methyltransferase domain-containing protein [Methylocystis sp. MJC1]
MNAVTLQFRCMYCGHRGPEKDFDGEHVFSRSLCGLGTNWTLNYCVCKSCNVRFSKFESELLHLAAEAIARGFSGPLGRSAKNAAGTRAHPLRMNHVYVQNKGDPLIYEAGFAFEGEFYFRPQMIDVGGGAGLATLIATTAEIPAFQAAVSTLVAQPKRLTLPRPPGQRHYEIVILEERHGAWRESQPEKHSSPSDVFFREFPDRPFRSVMTTRLAQNDDGKLFFRASDLNAVGSFLAEMFANRTAAPRPPLSEEPGDQTFFFGVDPDPNKVCKVVIKTGTNLVAHFYGSEIVENPAFDEVRNILLEDTASNAASGRCQQAPGATADFPHTAAESHQLMLDDDNGNLRFRMRLYNSFGYTCVLAGITPTLSKKMAPTLPRRVIVEFNGGGIREVSAWPNSAFPTANRDQLQNETTVTRRRYDRIAPFYDALEWLPEFRFRQWRQDLWGDVTNEQQILELGVGTGKSIEWYPSGAHVTAVDISEPMLERARRKAVRLGRDVNFEVADAQFLPFRDGTFDTVVTTFVFCSVPDPVKGLREARRVLKRGGRILIIEHVISRHPTLRRVMNWLDPITHRLWGAHINRDTVANVQRAGFTNVRSSDLALDIVKRIDAIAPAAENVLP